MEQSRTAGRSDWRQVWDHRVARTLFVAQSLSSVGDFVGLAALLLLAFVRSGGEPLGAAAMFAVQGIPAMAVSTFAGPWLDRVERRGALIACYLAGAVALLLPIIPGLWSVLAAGALLGALRPLIASLRQAIISNLVPADTVAPLMSAQQATIQGGMTVGYLAGAALTVAIGPAVALAADALTFVASAALVSTVPAVPPTVRERPSLAGGLRLVRSNPLLSRIAALMWVGAAVGGLPEALAPSLSSDPVWLPLLLASQSAGTLLGALALGPRANLRRLRSLGVVAAVGGLAFLATAGVLGWHPVWAIVGNVLIGGATVFMLLGQVSFAINGPAHRMGQLVASMVATIMLFEGLGALALGGLASIMSPAVAYAAAGVLLLIAAVRVAAPGVEDPAAPGRSQDALLPDPVARPLPDPVGAPQPARSSARDG